MHVPVFEPSLADRRERVRRQHLGPRAAVVRRAQFAVDDLPAVQREGVVGLVGKQEVLRVQPDKRLRRVLREQTESIVESGLAAVVAVNSELIQHERKGAGLPKN